jgi:hypothetical protein
LNADRRFWALVGTAVCALGAHAALGVALGEGYAIPTTLIALIGGAVVLKGPLGEALARRLQGGPAAELPNEQVFGELDDLRNRVAELEERVDFSERLLAKQRDEPG